MSSPKHNSIPSKIIYITGSHHKDISRATSSSNSDVITSNFTCCLQDHAVSSTGSFLSSPWHNTSPCTSPRHRSRSSSPTVTSSVSKLGYLADECSRLSASVGSVVSQSSQILNNSFLSTQEHLTEHVVTLNYKACWDIVTAIGTYEEYVYTMEEMVEALDKEEEDIVNKWNDLDCLAKQMFKKVNEAEQNKPESN